MRDYQALQGMAKRAAAVGACVAASTMIVGVGGASAATPSGGIVHVFVTLSANQSASDPIVLTGAIGDYGGSITIDKGGKTDPNGNYVKVTLRHGTFEADIAVLNKVSNSTQPSFNGTTCSALEVAAAPITVFDGTGSYVAISGTLKVTTTFAEILPRYSSGAHKGQCNMSNSAQPIASYGTVVGSGTVHFG